MKMDLLILLLINNIVKSATSCVSTCMRIEDKVDYLIKKEGSELNKIDKELTLILIKLIIFNLMDLLNLHLLQIHLFP